ncbi:MAG: hypothetical protein HDR92_08850 [Bacteroides sp.]|nr:hypothetical protein [Bacteroides sp.]
MTFNPYPLIRLVGSRSFAVVLIIASVVVTVIGAQTGSVNPVTPPTGGFGLPWPSQWITSPAISLVAALGVDFIAMAGIILLDRTFHIIRGLRGSGLLFAALYMLMQGVLPAAGHFCGGSVMVLVALASIFLLYSVYQSPDLRRVLLVFVMLGAGALVDYGFVPYILVMAVGCIQMRVMGLRAIVAILAGTLVPLWVLWNFGCVKMGDFVVPGFIDNFDLGSLRNVIPSIAATGVVILTGCATGLLDMLQVYARNARTRAFFGLFAVTGIMTGLLCVIDFEHISFYAPLLNLTTAFFVTLLYSFRQRNSLGAGTVAISVLTLLFGGFYIWKTIVSLML